MEGRVLGTQPKPSIPTPGERCSQNEPGPTRTFA